MSGLKETKDQAKPKRLWDMHVMAMVVWSGVMQHVSTASGCELCFQDWITNGLKAICAYVCTANIKPQCHSADAEDKAAFTLHVDLN